MPWVFLGAAAGWVAKSKKICRERCRLKWLPGVVLMLIVALSGWI